MSVIDKTLELISQKSVSGEQDQGAIEYLTTHLSKLGFKIIRKKFSGDESYDVDNFYAEYGSGEYNLCFAGHTDVVPSGDESSWSVPPFNPKVVDGVLFGRGAVDMKTSIACFMQASEEIIDENSENIDFSKKVKISFLITGDEEADAVNGTTKLLKFITDKSIKINSCLVGEPTSSEEFGDTIKVGRRGSLNFKLKVNGVQGHVAYPEKANNPNTIIVTILNELKSEKLDSGNKYFPPSNLEVTSIDVENKTTNLIPASATACFNIRFNDHHNKDSVRQWVEDICMKHSEDYDIQKIGLGSDSFLSDPARFADIVSGSISNIVGKNPELSTSGGTSDARFIKDYANEVVEFGLLNKTAHKIDEHANVEDIEKLKDIYKQIIKKTFDL